MRTSCGWRNSTGKFAQPGLCEESRFCKEGRIHEVDRFRKEDTMMVSDRPDSFMEKVFRRRWKNDKIKDV